MNLHLRQTGRTYRMLCQAVSLNAQGRAVYIYVHHEVFRRRLVTWAKELHLPSSVKIEVLPDDFNWSTMRPHDRMHTNCVCLVDHAAVEIHLQELDEQILKLQQLTRQLYHLTT